MSHTVTDPYGNWCNEWTMGTCVGDEECNNNTCDTSGNSPYKSGGPGC